MDNAQKFVGIDPEDTVDAEYMPALDGAPAVSFKLTIIEQGIWQRLWNNVLLENRRAMRRIIADMTKRGENPHAFFDESKDTTMAHREVLNDPEYREKLVEMQTEACRYAVAAHSGWFTRAGAPVPYQTVEKPYDGRTVRYMAEETARYYRVNENVRSYVWLEIKKLQTLGPAEKKA